MAKKKLTKKVIDDNRGQWAHPGEVTRINSRNITMKGVPYPVLGVGADGEERMMYPEEEHTFNQGPVTEYPMMEAQNGGWLSQYKKWKPNSEDLRADGTRKGTGYFGVLDRPDGGVSTEISIGVNINGKEVEIPTMVPTLTKEELNYLLTTPTDKEDLLDTPIGQSIGNKAVEFARERMNKGLNPFYQEGEERASLPRHLQNPGIASVYAENNQPDWTNVAPEKGYVSNYDMLGYATHHPFGALLHAINPEKFHATDEYKRPNHPTFSDESKYSNSEHQGGHWNLLPDNTWTFQPSQYNIDNMGGTEKYQQWWNENEPPGNTLILPQHKRGGVTWLNEYAKGGKVSKEELEYLQSVAAEDIESNPRNAEIERQKTELAKKAQLSERSLDLEKEIAKQSLLSKLKEFSGKNQESDDYYIGHSTPKEVIKNNYIYTNPGDKVVTNTEGIIPRIKPVNAVDDGIFLAFADAVAEYKELYPNRPVPRISSGLRTRAEQEQLYANRGNNRYPVAKPGTSKHELGQALDIVFDGGNDSDYQRLANLMSPRGFKWLGDYDKVHFEVDPNYPKTDISENGNVIITNQMPSMQLDVNRPKARSFKDGGWLNKFEPGGPFLPGMNPLMPSVLMSPRQLKNTTEVALDALSFVPELAIPAYVGSLPFTLYDIGEDVYIHKPWYKTTADAAGLIPYLKYTKSLPASGLKKAEKVVEELKAVNNLINVFNTANDITDTYNDSNLPPGTMLPQVTITPKKKNGGWLNNFK